MTLQLMLLAQSYYKYRYSFQYVYFKRLRSKPYYINHHLSPLANHIKIIINYGPL